MYVQSTNIISKLHISVSMSLKTLRFINNLQIKYCIPFYLYRYLNIYLYWKYKDVVQKCYRSIKGHIVHIKQSTVINSHSAFRQIHISSFVIRNVQFDGN